MNTALSHAQSVWRAPVPSVSTLEGAILAYTEEVVAPLNEENARLKTALAERDARIFSIRHALGLVASDDLQKAVLNVAN